jgi:heme exporter protein CcmD
MTEFFAMNGYGFYVWSAYGVAALALAIEVSALRSRRRAVLEEARLVQPEAPATAASPGSGAPCCCSPWPSGSC